MVAVQNGFVFKGEGKSVIFVHHAGKNGKPGSSRRGCSGHSNIS